MICYNNLKEVNINEALKTMGGYEQILQKVVSSFLDSYKDLPETIDELLTNDILEARRLVHSIKGIALNVGSKNLYEVSTTLENAIINREITSIKLYLMQFKNIFSDVYQDLSNITFK